METNTTSDRQRATLTTRGPVGVITINRPEVRNAIDLPTAELIAQHVDETDVRDDIRVVVLAGAGGTFCAGMDLRSADARPVVAGRGFAGFVERPPRKPVIAAVEGFAVGGGCELALASDMVVAASSARFGLPEVKRGLTAAAGGLFRLARRIPPALAMEMLLTGEMITSERGHELGLVNRISDDGAALDLAIELASVIATNGPLAVQTTKQLVNASLGWDPAEGFELQAAAVDRVRRSADAREGATAFIEKRSPVWTGN